ncbi:MAG: hypothetical protein ACOYJZ_11390 [Acutalibacter sp.]|jgi:hypothetical protein
MRETVTETNIPIPAALDSRVQESLRQVRRIHRGRVLRRAGGTLSSLVVICGVFVTLAAVNPALASQVPLVGRWLGTLFYDANYESKTGTPGAFLETYDVLEEVDTAAQSGDWTVTVLEGYSDGSTVQLSLGLTGPQEELDSFSGVDVGSYGLDGGAVVTVNGEQATVDGVNPFYEREGQWTTTMTVDVPESQRSADTLALEVTLQNLTGRVESQEAQAAADQYQRARLEWEANEETAGTPYPEEAPSTTVSQPIEGSFAASFSLTVDREHSFSFAADAESNGAKVLAVSGTPAQTVITVEKPFWGLLDSVLETEIPTQGIPCLELGDGTQLWLDLDRSQDLGGYDNTLQETQQADIYFDGLPQGTTQVTLVFYQSGQGQESPALAEFSIDLAAQTVTP